MNSFIERKFEVVSSYDPKTIKLPYRATRCSAGYDICAAHDIIIPSIWHAINKINTPQKLAVRCNLTAIFMR